MMNPLITLTTLSSFLQLFLSWWDFLLPAIVNCRDSHRQILCLLSVISSPLSRRRLNMEIGLEFLNFRNIAIITKWRKYISILSSSKCPLPLRSSPLWDCVEWRVIRFLLSAFVQLLAVTFSTSCCERLLPVAHLHNIICMTWTYDRLHRIGPIRMSTDLG